MKVLLTATVQSHICQFHKPLVEVLHKHGCEVHVAARDNLAEKNGLKLDFVEKVYDIPFARSPKSKDNIQAYKELKNIINKEKYDVIHCNTPMGGIVTRLAAKQARKQGTKVYYTAHGFHFFKGAPKINWLLFYPIEKLCSYWTDILITINREDYQRAKKSFHAKKIEYVPGVGIDLKKFQTGLIDVEKKRKELGLGDTETMLLSVGELSTRKNHEVVIKALGKLQNKKMLENVHYFICGKGELLTKLKLLVHELELDSVVKFLGFRQDISELCQAADLFIFPSLQEGLPVALMEAIACKTPVICSKIRGNEDLINCKDDMFQAMDVESVFINIKEKCVDETGEIRRALVMEKMENNVDANYRILQRFSLSFVDKRMHQIYQDIM